jgi:RND family efflux transporter MFP subunit
MTQETEGQNRSTATDVASADAGSKRRFVLGGIALAAIVLLGVGMVPRLVLHRDLLRQQVEESRMVPNVFVTIAQASPMTVSVQLSGTMSPITEAPVLARVDGYLKKRMVDIGDRVHIGEVLAVIEAPDLDQQVSQAAALVEQSKANLSQSQSTLEQAKANAGIAKITADRWAALVKKGAVSKQANDNYQFAYSAQTAEVGVATASVAAATNSIGANTANHEHYRELQSFEVVKAPFDGVITERNVDNGALITATDTLLFRIAKNDVLRTFIDVPQITAPTIKVGDTAELVFVQYPSHVFQGKVTRTADSLNLNTRTLLTEVDVDNNDGLLLPGMYATVNFDLPRSVSSVFIPGEAMIFRADGTTVAVVGQDNMVHIKKVTVGHDYGATLEIVSGLQVGDHVVVNPNDTTVEAARVHPVIVSHAAGSLNPAPATTHSEVKNGKSK